MFFGVVSCLRTFPFDHFSLSLPVMSRTKRHIELSEQVSAKRRASPAHLQTLTETVEAISIPDECTICRVGGFPSLLSLCGQRSHGVCPFCMWKYACSKSSWKLVLSSPHMVHPDPPASIHCPLCRGGPSVVAAQSDPIFGTHLPGVWVRTYDKVKLQSLKDTFSSSRAMPSDLKGLWTILKLQEHLQPDVPPCPFECKTTFNRLAEYETHVKSCEARSIPCPDCQQQVLTSKIKHHVKRECQSLKCQASPHCQVIGAWSDIATHVLEHSNPSKTQRLGVIQSDVETVGEKLRMLTALFEQHERLDEAFQRLPNQRMEVSISVHVAVSHPNE